MILGFVFGAKKNAIYWCGATQENRELVLKVLASLLTNKQGFLRVKIQGKGLRVLAHAK